LHAVASDQALTLSSPFSSTDRRLAYAVAFVECTSPIRDSNSAAVVEKTKSRANIRPSIDRIVLVAPVAVTVVVVIVLVCTQVKYFP